MCVACGDTEITLGDEEENIWVERSHLFLWLKHSLPSPGFWEVYLLKEHLSSCLSKPPLCHLNASVIQSSTILPGNTSTSSVDKDTQICVSYSCKSPLTARLSCLLAKAFPGKAGTRECLALCLHCMQRLEPALSFQSLVSKAKNPSKSLKEEEGLWEQTDVGIWCGGPGRTNRLFSCPRVVLGTAREMVVS